MIRDSLKNMLIRGGVVGLAAAVMSAAGATPDGLAGNEIDVEVGIAASSSEYAQDGGGSGRSVTVTRNRTEVDGKVIEVEVRNNEITLATLDGRAIPRSRIVRSENGGTITILGDDNKELTVINIDPAGTPLGQPSLPRQRATVRVAPATPTPPAFPATPGTAGTFYAVHPAPASIIGIVPRDLPDRDAVIIDGVREGLGAEKAGLRAGDIILAVDGIDELDANKLREFIGKRKPGTELRLTVERNGHQRTISVITNENPAAAGQPFRPQVFHGGMAPRIITRAVPGADIEGRQIDLGDIHLEIIAPEDIEGGSFVGRFGDAMIKFDIVKPDDIAALVDQLGGLRDRLNIEVEALNLGGIENRLLQRLEILTDPNNEEGGLLVRRLATSKPISNIEGRLSEIENRLDRMEATLQRIAERLSR